MYTEIHFTAAALVAPTLVLPSREVGAVVEFQGIVREREGEQALQGLFYEAYEPMARRQLERIFTELAALHPVQAVLFFHRLGWVPVGESSLFVRVFFPVTGAKDLPFAAARLIG
ncbi:MAG: molybdenum cofactor biosynthesis protein MoaE [Verrucomicrobiaceae bacterium]|nr:MAG: molybdenum cofactor biosynthesis protein MoaE [Verrucomicrobiaceae bacterium]